MKSQISLEYLILFAILSFVLSIILFYLMKSQEMMEFGIDKANSMRESMHYGGLLSLYYINFGYSSGIKIKENVTLICEGDICYVMKGTAKIPLQSISYKVVGNFV